MSGPEVIKEVAELSASTWDHKVMNIIRILDENGYKGAYYTSRTADTNLLHIVFPTHIFVVMLPMVDSERVVLRTVDDYFAEYEHDRVHEGEGGFGDG